MMCITGRATIYYIDLLCNTPVVENVILSLKSKYLTTLLENVLPKIVSLTRDMVSQLSFCKLFLSP